jgi:hypothetical protein
MSGLPVGPSTTRAVPDHDARREALSFLRSLVGTWRGGGEVWLPTRPATEFDEEIRFAPLRENSVEYGQHATHRADGSPSHAEFGIWRVVDDGTIEVSVAIGGAVEASEGRVRRDGLELVSRGVVRATSSVRFAGTTRRYQLAGDVLTYDVELATVTYPLSSHLRAELRRVR